MEVEDMADHPIGAEHRQADAGPLNPSRQFHSSGSGCPREVLEPRPVGFQRRREHLPGKQNVARGRAVAVFDWGAIALQLLEQAGLDRMRIPMLLLESSDVR